MGPLIDNEIDKSYFNWLVESIAYRQYDEYDDAPFEYRTLLRILYDYEFTWSVHNDDNRIADGLDLRDYFFEEMGYDNPDRLHSFASERPCSVLEMIYALARRCENELMYTPYLGDQTSKWFWMMLENLGLLKFDDGSFEERDYDEVYSIIDRMVLRHYKSNGEGGLFPLAHPRKDQRKVEIWYQMQAYLDENYTL